MTPSFACVYASGARLLSSALFVRYTFTGTILNGRRLLPKAMRTREAAA